MKGLLLPDGRKFAWRESSCGTPLILIHGWGSSSAVFAELIGELSDYHCFAPDLPGYGASTAAEHVDLDTLTTDFINWFNALGLKSVSLLGWSLGGILAQNLAARFPSLIERLILIATTPRFVRAPDWPHGLADSAVRALARDFKQAPTLTLKNFQILQFQEETSVPSPMVPTVDMATALSGLELLCQVDLRRQLARVTMPTLVLHGSNDTIIPVDAGRFLAANLPQALFQEISGCGHAPFRSDVKQVGAAVNRFLS